MSTQTFHEIDFASAAGTFVGSEASEGQGYISMDGIFTLAAKSMRIFLRDNKGEKRRNLSVAYGVTDTDVPGAEGVQLSQDYLLDGYIKDVTPPKAIAVQSLGRLFMQHGMTEKEAQAAMAKLPKLGAASDRAREDAFCKAVLGAVVGRTAVANVVATAKADGTKLISVIKSFTTAAALASTKLSGNGFRNQQNKAVLEAERMANAAGVNKKTARATPAKTGGSTGAPAPAIDINEILSA